MDYLKGLNESQYEAVTTIQGPLMVLAGAGSGKTRVLTMRIAHLIQNGVDPFNILALTFTNKAAREMKERIARVVGDSDAKSIWMGTFHSIFARILRMEAHYLGFPSNFTIYDSQDALNVIKKVLKEMSIDSDLYKPKKVLNRISQYKNNLITVNAYFNNPELMEADEMANMKLLGEIYRKYVETCYKSGAMDFDDLLLRTNELLTRFPDVLAKYQDRFRYILVDEYQDTNHSQYLIVKALASKFENLCVVGDDAQSIYAFRGANIYNILNFKKDYPDAVTVSLEQNYRSTQNIVNAANDVIAKNQQQFKKNVFSENEPGDKIQVYRSLSDADEANFVASQILENSMRNQRKYSDFAILYRTNSQTRAFEDALRRKNIPYKVYGGLSFYQRKEIKDLIAYLRLLVNENDQEALLRIINYPTRGIGETTQNKLIVTADQLNISMAELLNNLQMYGPQTGFNAGTLNKLSEFWNMIKAFQVMMKTETVYQVAMDVAQKSGLLKLLKDDQTPEGVSRMENIQELMNSLQGFIEEQQQLEDGDPGLSNFLENIALSTDTQDKDDDNNKVSLMTIHLSKGLEFPVVHIVGLEENLFPSFMSANTREELEEERRLFYVALTRAEKQAIFSYAVSRFQWGKITDSEPSRFLSEVDTMYLDFLNPATDTRFRNSSGLTSSLFDDAPPPRLVKKDAPKKLTPTPALTPKNLKPVASAKINNPSGGTTDHIEVGDMVRHDRFGVGEVVFLDGTDPQNIKAKVLFQHEGEKNLILKFAKLTKIS
ncbi:ATP-dependent helicase [Elizabethkingia anophelis]|uniref:ATP-dependent helicase n=1 Tax=Elizabethkingia anophelis TaxID=1117645 RepID=UPI002226F688|nr:UvrD-helicase domain-containing protein [Elizabethkingia anophelis]MCW2463800.1 DNA helicase-2/ATP-dependent DNA helicase PcrA [Elizabethkingia anophelis]MCW2467484.1 DNA helicase-2/ATP-dependent DNA helicase PcrA [Elizabethkingia anophelis]MCW2470368.1 DNA helicase-2/ATP-dependent DNA helicase PcrA [Elizabethkingia anophelis]HBI9692020.1 UvrD-helicase domain-containing protein [Elizabethkingia anophelis]HBI9693490.1 UvrD-helicase domain-containing protein [Elizabethkingia anophelis]